MPNDEHDFWSSKMDVEHGSIIDFFKNPVRYWGTFKILFRKMSLKRDHCEKQTSANLDRHEEINVNLLFYS